MDLPPELTPENPTEAIQIHVPLPVVGGDKKNASEGAQEVNLYMVEKGRLQEIQNLGVSIEGIGVATMAQGNLHATGMTLVTLMGRLATKAERKDLTAADLGKIGNNIGYLAGKLAIVMDTSRKVLESNGRPIDAGSPQKQTKKSFQPGAIVHAAPGSTVNVGIAERRES